MGVKLLVFLVGAAWVATANAQANLTVNRAGFAPKIYLASAVVCKQSRGGSIISMQDAKKEISLYFNFTADQIRPATYSLRSPNPDVYFDSAYMGTVLGWDPTLPKCDLVIAKNDKTGISGELDCSRIHAFTHSSTAVIGIQAQFSCTVSK